MAASVKTKNRVLALALAIGTAGAAITGLQLHGIAQFNQAVQAGKAPQNSDFKFEAKYAAAHTLAKSGRYQDAAQLFGQLMESGGTPTQIAAVQYNLGNIFVIRGLMVHRNDGAVSDEAEYLLTQAKLAYQQSLRLDNTHFDARHNLDRVLALLPEDAAARDEQDKLGIVMGNIPTGLP